jgi:putative SOS response-associated peptidase YedK
MGILERPSQKASPATKLPAVIAVRQTFPIFSFIVKDERPFTFAGLWENWKDPETGEWLRTCTISQASLMSS